MSTVYPLSTVIEMPGSVQKTHILKSASSKEAAYDPGMQLPSNRNRRQAHVNVNAPEPRPKWPWSCSGLGARWPALWFGCVSFFLRPLLAGPWASCLPSCFMLASGASPRPQNPAPGRVRIRNSKPKPKPKPAKPQGLRFKVALP